MPARKKLIPTEEEKDDKKDNLKMLQKTYLFYLKTKTKLYSTPGLGPKAKRLSLRTQFPQVYSVIKLPE